MFKLVITLLFICHYTFAVNDVKVIDCKYSGNKDKEIIDFSQMKCKCSADYEIECTGSLDIKQALNDDTMITSTLRKCESNCNCHKIIDTIKPTGICSFMKKHARLIKSYLGIQTMPTCPMNPESFKNINAKFSGKNVLHKIKVSPGLYKFELNVSNTLLDATSYVFMFIQVE